MTDGSTSVRSEVKKVMTKFQQMYPNRACFLHQLDKAGILYRHIGLFFSIILELEINQLNQFFLGILVKGPCTRFLVENMSNT